MSINLNMGPVVASLAGSTVTRNRPGATTIDAAGHAATAAATTASLKCVMQRPGPDALRRLPEGERSRARWLIHTTGDIRGADEGAAVLADTVTFGGKTYKVVDITDQSEHGSYRRCLLLTGGV